KMDTIKILPKWTKLSQIHRNEKESRLPLLSKTLLVEDAEERWNLFNTELKKCMKRGDVAYFQSNNNKEIANLTVDYYLDQKKISLLTTRHENDVGRMMLNTKIQKRISGNTGFEKNVIILQNRNDYFHGVFKGEKGKADNDWLVGYATTVHKSQGSEAEMVLLPIWKEPGAKIWNRSLLYTALTRGTDTAVFVGNEEAMELAVKNRGGFRSTILPLLYRSIVKRKAT